MRFAIWKMKSNRDPRFQSFGNLAELAKATELIGECATQSEAAAECRLLYPDSVGMPFQLKVGSGTLWMLGLVEDVTVLVNVKKEVPFVLLVHAIDDTPPATNVPGRPRPKSKSKPMPFWVDAWRLPVIRPSNQPDPISTPVEVRSTGIDIPQRASASLFSITRNGERHAVLHVEIGGVPLSVEFLDGRIEAPYFTERP